ncbi:hypothetical protein CEXT_350691 [Caerostris extrusa]|uniref:Uncharacterized protein n=1 Tax=Caerostris extrusa TaxID=172846 RepID=A0AAV4P4Y7_CAEEX|nr:hypothetical protein CEXT_350691 [Caerostris extrusa]
MRINGTTYHQSKCWRRRMHADSGSGGSGPSDPGLVLKDNATLAIMFFADSSRYTERTPPATESSPYQNQN